MLHSLEEIKKNQKNFFEEIVSFLKKNVKEARKELIELESKNEEIIKLKENLQKRVNKFKLIPEIEKYFFTEKYIPKFYAFWEEDTKEVIIYKFKK
jgi:hypothetical protein